MTRTSRYRPQHLKGSPLEDWIATALAKQAEPHTFEPGRRGGCAACGLDESTPNHGDGRDDVSAITEQRAADDAAEFYDPAADDYDLAKDPRCLWGWGPPTCHCRDGHACFRALGHPGLCGYTSEGCRKRRPKDWDAKGRAEANR